MAIKFNENEIATVTFNASPLSSVHFNDAEVYAVDDLVEYTFPNSSAYQASTGSFGFTSFGDTASGSLLVVNKAFDNDPTTYFEMTKATDHYRMGLSFPFPVLIQSMTIKDSRYTSAGSCGWLSLLHSASIYVDPTHRQSVHNTEHYADIERLPGLEALGVTDETSFANFWKNGGVTYTTHTNPEYADPAKEHWIQSLCIHGTAWGGNGKSSGGYRTISEVAVTFKAKKSDLEAWASTHNITL